MRAMVAVVGGVAVAVAAMVGCSVSALPDDGPRDGSNDPPDSSFVPQDSARGDALAPLNPQRLVRGPQTYTDAAGKVVELPDGWKDLERNEVCGPFLSTDGATRCLPLDGTAVWRKDGELVYVFADASCTTTAKAVLVDAAVKAPAKYLRAPYRSVEVMYEIYKISKSTSRDFYVFDLCATDGGAPPADAAACNVCRRVTAPAGTDVYTTTEEIRPASFGEFRVY